MFLLGGSLVVSSGFGSCSPGASVLLQSPGPEETEKMESAPQNLVGPGVLEVILNIRESGIRNPGKMKNDSARSASKQWGMFPTGTWISPIHCVTSCLAFFIFLFWFLIFFRLAAG